MSKQIATVDQSLTKLEGFTTIQDMRAWATAAIDSGLLPNSITEPEQVMVIVQHGKELGLTPYVAINNINVISGRPTISSVMLGSLLKRKKVEWIWDEDFAVIKNEKGDAETAPDGTPNRRTTIHFYWKSEITERVMEATFSVTWAQFVLAGLTKKDNWVRLPKEMLRARCLSAGCRALFPEVLSGFYTDIEIQDVISDDSVSIKLNEEGDVILTNNK
jgi:hypothetical protein